MPDKQQLRSIICTTSQASLIYRLQCTKNTFLSLPKGPLVRRDNLVLSSSLSELDIKNIKDKYIGTYVEFFKNKKELDEYIKKKEYKEIWIIGGEQIYNLYMSSTYINEIHLTYIDEDYECDTFFPEINKHKFISKSLSYATCLNNKNVNVYNVIYKS